MKFAIKHRSAMAAKTIFLFVIKVYAAAAAANLIKRIVGIKYLILYELAPNLSDESIPPSMKIKENIGKRRKGEKLLSLFIRKTMKARKKTTISAAEITLTVGRAKSIPNNPTNPLKKAEVLAKITSNPAISRGCPSVENPPKYLTHFIRICADKAT
jgi:hypothetical protein